MKLIRRILATLRSPRPARPRYGEEVLFAGWVQLPRAFREIIRRR
jgi:hypothetical protein